MLLTAPRGLLEAQPAVPMVDGLRVTAVAEVPSAP